MSTAITIQTAPDTPTLACEVGPKEFVRIVRMAARVTEKRGSMPILQTLRLEAHASGALTVTGTDLETVLTADCEAWVTVPGECCVDAKALSALLRKAQKGEPVKLALHGDGLTVSCGAAVTLPTSPMEEWPELPTGQPDRLEPLSGAELAEVLSVVSHSSTDASRYNLNSVYLESVETGTRFVTTDGHRLAVKDTGWQIPGLVSEGRADTRGVILPRAAVLLLRTPDAKRSGTVAIGVDGQNFHARGSDGWKFQTRLIDGEFPNYRQVIPRERGSRVTFPAAALADALKRLQVIWGGTRSHAVRFDPHGAGFTVTASNPDTGEAVEAVSAAGELPCEVAFNARYLLDALALQTGDPVTLELLADPPKDNQPARVLSPARLTAATDPTLVAVVMPMRL